MFRRIASALTPEIAFVTGVILAVSAVGQAFFDGPPALTVTFGVASSAAFAAAITLGAVSHERAERKGAPTRQEPRTRAWDSARARPRASSDKRG